MMVSYDPGVKVAGVALWEASELRTAFLARGDGWLSTAHAALRGMPWYPEITEIAIEIPQVYVQSRLKGDPNDLITVALNAGAFCSQFPNITPTEYRPHEWKKQVPKAILAKRTQTRLSIDELNCIEQAPKALMHNVFDAIGIGLHHLKRK